MPDVLVAADDWPVDTVAVGVTGPDGTLDVHGAVDSVLPFASVTKPLVAYAVLIAVQDGALHLDEPAGPLAGQGATVRHLLAHASGLAPDRSGPTTSPGTRRIYSNWGFEVLGDLIAERVGVPIAQHLDVEVLAPLHMADTVLDGSPAADARGTATDLLAFARELLSPTLLDADLHAEATAVAFPGLDGVLPGFGRQSPNDWALGFEIKDDKSPHWTGKQPSPRTFGHFGRSGSFLWVDPDADLAGVCLADRAFGQWASDAWPGFIDAVHDAYA